MVTEFMKQGLMLPEAVRGKDCAQTLWLSSLLLDIHLEMGPSLTLPGCWAHSTNRSIKSGDCQGIASRGMTVSWSPAMISEVPDMQLSNKLGGFGGCR